MAPPSTRGDMGKHISKSVQCQDEKKSEAQVKIHKNSVHRREGIISSEKKGPESMKTMRIAMEFIIFVIYMM
jgi:hypothetical protein